MQHGLHLCNTTQIPGGFVGFGDALSVYTGSDAVLNIVVCSEFADDVGVTDDGSGLAECDMVWGTCE